MLQGFTQLLLDMASLPHQLSFYIQPKAAGDFAMYSYMRDYEVTIHPLLFSLTMGQVTEKESERSE